LSGTVKPLKRDGIKVRWSKQSGPGTVKFAEANASETSHAFRGGRLLVEVCCAARRIERKFDIEYRRMIALRREQECGVRAPFAAQGLKMPLR
jgi:hypothetical protein